MPAGHYTAETASAGHRLIDTGVDAALVDIASKNSKCLADGADSANESVPKVAVEPITEERGGSAPEHDRAGIHLINPHPVRQKSEQRRLGTLERITLSIWHRDAIEKCA